MIQLENLTKAYWYRGQPKYIARNLNATIPDGARVALMGRNGAGVDDAGDDCGQDQP